MCGFAGFFNTSNLTDHARILECMGLELFNRGPDSFGIWFNSDDRIGLVHRRLAIVDLSAAGHQPMTSDSGRYIISYNGEIYNHQELRDELESIRQYNWRGHSDTETLLAAIEQWGLKITLQKATGMFGIALWDTLNKELYLARDRFGEKPVDRKSVV